MKAAFEEGRHWLEGSRFPFSVLTDHRNLEYLRSARRLNHRKARWALFFTWFQFTVTYHPGSKNTKADAQIPYLLNVHPTGHLYLLPWGPESFNRFMIFPVPDIREKLHPSNFKYFTYFWKSSVQSTLISSRRHICKHNGFLLSRGGLAPRHLCFQVER